MTENRFPPGWDEERVGRVLDHYEEQTDEQGVAEDEDSYDTVTRTVLEVPKDLLPVIRQLISKHKAV
ncbi:MAG: hypothetical protein ACRDLB_08640 [Actinomycetota bacterium]